MCFGSFKKMNLSRISFLLLFTLTFVLIPNLEAQTTGTLSGTVNNSAGAAVPSAAVTVTLVSGGAPQRVITGSDGTFTIVNLPPGTYRVDVEYSGYKRSSIQNVDLSTGGAAQIKVELQQGDTRETVEVQGSAVLIQPDNAEISKALDSRLVTNVPLFDRNHQELVQLLPGITPPRTADSILLDPQQNRLWETNGLSNSTNRRTLDGVENQEPNTGVGVYVTPLESVQQVDIATSNYNARLGRGAGTILNPVTRAGTNQLHGGLFAFNSVSAMSARNYFNPEGLPQARYTLNQFGLNAGGPIRRDSTFFLVSYEGRLDRRQVPTLTTVPTADFRAGNFSAVPGLTLFNPATGSPSGANRSVFAGNIIPASQISPIARAILPLFPSPNLDGFENNLIVNTPLRNDGHRGDVRFDHKIGDVTNLFARWSYANYNTVQDSPLGLLGGGTAHLQNHNAMIGGTHTFGATTNADLRFSYTRWANKLNSSVSPDLTASGLGFNDPNAAGLGFPQIQINGLQTIGTPVGFPRLAVDSTLSLVNGWNSMMGRHSLHFGFDIWGVRSDGFPNNPFGPEGSFLFGPGATSSPAGTGLGPFGSFANSFAGFLLGTPTQAGRSFPTVTPSYTSIQGSVYLSDTMRASSKLSLDLGVRYDVFSPVAPRRNEGVFIYDSSANQLLPTNTGGVDNVGNVHTSWKNVAPRFGFAYRPMERTVVRGGYGITFFNGPLNFFTPSLISDPGVASGVVGGFATTSFGRLPDVPATAATASPIPAPNSTMYFTPRYTRTPYVQHFNFMLEGDLGRYGLIGSIGYVGNLGRHLLYARDINAAQPGAGFAGLPLNAQFGRTAPTIQTTSGLNSNYNALQASLTKRFGAGLSFTTAYTYSRALDYSAGGLTPLLNNLDIRSNYGPADWDRTHMFTLSHVWQLPIGANSTFLNQGILGRILGPWQIDGMFRWVSGTPLTLTADPTLCNCPGNTPTASTIVTGTSTTFIPVPTAFGFLPVRFESLNFAFTQPPPNSLGNLGRNSVRGPGFANYDVSLFRSFVIRDQTRLEIRGEAFNITNTPHFANPIGNVNSAAFGQSIGTLRYAPERRLQVAARLLF